jgi:hypothetical protein
MSEEHTVSIFRVEEKVKPGTRICRWKGGLSLEVTSAGFLLRLLFDPEDGGNMFL